MFQLPQAFLFFSETSGDLSVCPVCFSSFFVRGGSANQPQIWAVSDEVVGKMMWRHLAHAPVNLFFLLLFPLLIIQFFVLQQRRQRSQSTGFPSCEVPDTTWAPFVQGKHLQNISYFWESSMRIPRLISLSISTKAIKEGSLDLSALMRSEKKAWAT